MGIGIRALVTVATALVLGNAAQAQDAPAASFSAPQGFALKAGGNYFGVTLGRAYSDAHCAATMLFCDSRDRSAQLFAGKMFDTHWGAELGYMDTGRLPHGLLDSRAQAFSLSVVGRAKVLPALGVYGKVGTTYGRPDTSVMGNSAAGSPDAAFGVAWGAGVSYDLSPRLSATLELGTYDLRLGAGPVRSGTLGVQYRY